MMKIYLVAIFLFNAVFSYAQYNPRYNAPKQNHHINRSGQSNIAFFTVIGGVSCLLAPGVQFSSGIGFGFTSYNSSGDGFLIAAGVILIGISVGLLIANERNKIKDETIRPLFKYEKISPIASHIEQSPGFPAAGIRISLK